MNKRVVVRFVPPAPVKVSTGKGTSRLRAWKTDKLIEFLEVGLAPLVAQQFPDIELSVIESRAADVRFEGWKPEKPTAMREAIGEMVGTVMEDIEAEEFLEA
ncbi:hypothetical protein GO986_08480 [Deinococcus sp. HMF7620]|uniref:Uncharacterized protein n=1 Tax=Deinococcus arboris TaxID=2682977 RepID=A0A7C9LLS0_9DEIO|nr:hypothetical protein [Deinococcus arboris]MVN86797.1 hypothetical protein [Deinococcus arboris]